MAHRSLLRGLPLLVILSAGLGGIAPDVCHLARILFKVEFNFIHSFSFWYWWTGASLVGLITISILRRKKAINYQAKIGYAFVIQTND